MPHNFGVFNVGHPRNLSRYIMHQPIGWHELGADPAQTLQDPLIFADAG
jgi:hypothetical protein